MNASNQQIVSLYDSSQGELTPEDIYEAMNGEVNLAAIKIALMNGSVLYRSRVKQKQEVFTDEDLDAASRVIKGLMYSADSDIVKLRAAILVHDEKTGKRNVNNIKNINFSMTLINQELQASERAIQMAKEKTIEIDDRHKHLKEIAA